MRLGEFRDALAKEPQDWPVVFEGGGAVGRVASWRGVYAQATLEHGSEPRTVAEVLEEVESLLSGEIRHGYKGGDFTFDRGTPLWADDYGRVEYRVPVGIRSDVGRRVMVTTQVIPDEYREMW